MTPVDQEIYELTIEDQLFEGNYDHYSLSFQIQTDFDTNETPKTRRVRTLENWEKFGNLLIGMKIGLKAPKGSPDKMMDFYSRKITEAYDEAIPIEIIKFT